MSFYTSGMFWFIEGILATVMVLGFKTWMEDRGNPMPFWKWLIFGFWVLLLGFTIAFVFTSMGEKEMVAASKGAIIFGLLTVVSGVGFWRLINKGTPPKKKEEPAKPESETPPAQKEAAAEVS